jgi:hypothetical protein
MTRTFCALHLSVLGGFAWLKVSSAALHVVECPVFLPVQLVFKNKRKTQDAVLTYSTLRAWKKSSTVFISSRK